MKERIRKQKDKEKRKAHKGNNGKISGGGHNRRKFSAREDIN